MFRAGLILLCVILRLGAYEADTPASYKGRFRPLEAYARLWLYDIYHHQAIKKEHLSSFHTASPNALDLLWEMHFRGPTPLKAAPLFWVHYAALKTALGLDPQENYFSYSQLSQAILSSPSFLKRVLAYHYFTAYTDSANRGHAEKLELSALSQGLWVAKQGHKLTLLVVPQTSPWNSLHKGDVILEDIATKELIQADRGIADEFAHLHALLNRFEQSSGTSLSTAGTTLLLLPSRYQAGDWFSLKALKLQTADSAYYSNFTLYPDALFDRIRSLYLQLEQAYVHREDDAIPALRTQLSQALMEGYEPLAGHPYREAYGKALYYPSIAQLKTETFYYHFPLVWITIALYCVACCLFFGSISLNHKPVDRMALCTLWAAFLLHTAILGLRIFILQRPPVSNMFETMIYVPWIAVLTSLSLRCLYANPFIPFAASLLATALLILLQMTNSSASMENVQAVLDSQYWLIVHVLMVVGSYGLFLLCGILGHLYLISSTLLRSDEQRLDFLGKCILQTMYMGVALLIPGTILGGVWAAESWGRFWDWDPKEAWAFISSCVYLIWIHAYRFHYIRHFGLAIGAVVGLQAIAFTWYGVNYILGTGLHSYGFGSGGEIYFYFYMVIEFLFLFWIVLKNRQNRAQHEGNT